MSTTRPPAEIAETDPLAHPVFTSIRLFDYSTPPGDHLTQTYNALWKACDEGFPHAPTRVARLMPRGHGKTEGVGVVFPTWLVLARPDVRVAVISKTAGLAAERTKKIVNSVERHADRFGVDLAETSKTELTTAAGERHKEATVSAWGLESNLTGRHFDAIVYDDIAEWDNQRTERQRQTVRNRFTDYVDNLPSNDSVLPNGPVQAHIGTRKHQQDIHATHVLDSKTWDTDIYTAIHPDDWWVVEERAWQIRGSDGNVYESIADLPPDVNIANNGVLPTADVRVLWPEFQPPEALLYDIVDGDDSTAVWQRENQQDPEALSGQVFSSEMLTYTDALPERPLAWVAGMDLGLVDDPQKAAEGDTDYFALAVIGVDPDADRMYLDHLARKRGLSVEAAASWARSHLEGTAADSPGYDVNKLYVEQNAGRGVGQRLAEKSHLPAENVSSSGDKHERIHNMAAEFESGDLRIHGDPKADPWVTFEQNEWLPFPTGDHDDMLDAIELAVRAADTAAGAASATATVGSGDDPSPDDGLDALVERQARERHSSGWK